jgi:phosphoglycerol transferase MdoB-like AlkP superfamily enzyme
MEKQRITIQIGGVGFMLFLTFMVLKLCNVIDWSWWWVTCPLWGVRVVLVVMLIIFLVIGVLYWFLYWFCYGMFDVIKGFWK